MGKKNKTTLQEQELEEIEALIDGSSERSLRVRHNIFAILREARADAGLRALFDARNQMCSLCNVAAPLAGDRRFHMYPISGKLEEVLCSAIPLRKIIERYVAFHPSLLEECPF